MGLISVWIFLYGSPSSLLERQTEAELVTVAFVSWSPQPGSASAGLTPACPKTLGINQGGPFTPTPFSYEETISEEKSWMPAGWAGTERMKDYSDQLCEERRFFSICPPSRPYFLINYSLRHGENWSCSEMKKIFSPKMNEYLTHWLTSMEHMGSSQLNGWIFCSLL